jgi:hypothetical protein
LKRKMQRVADDQPSFLDPDPPVSVSVRLVGGLNELVRNEASASDMDVSSWIRKACWDQLRDIEYGAMERRLLASFDALRADVSQRQQQIWNGVAASFSVLLQLIESDPNTTIDEGTLAKALQYFNQFRSRPTAARQEAGNSNTQSDSGAKPSDGDSGPGRIISFG